MHKGSVTDDTSIPLPQCADSSENTIYVEFSHPDGINGANQLHGTQMHNWSGYKWMCYDGDANNPKYDPSGSGNSIPSHSTINPDPLSSTGMQVNCVYRTASNDLPRDAHRSWSDTQFRIHTHKPYIPITYVVFCFATTSRNCGGHVD